MKRLAREGQEGERAEWGEGYRGNRSVEVIGCEPSATKVASVELTQLPIYVIILTKVKLGHC